MTENEEWRLFRGDRVARQVEFPKAPPWRQFSDGAGTRPRHRPYLDRKSVV